MSNQNQEVQNLFNRIAESDDEKAFSIFFEMYHTRMLRFAQLHVKSIQAAEDVVSEVLINLLRRRGELFKKQNFVGYLFKCVKNKCVDYLRYEKKRLGVTDNNYDEKDYFIFDNQTPFSRLIHSELNTLLMRRIEELPPKRRLVFKLVKDENMSYKQVADLMHISDRTVEVHIKLAMKDIRETLDAYLDELPDQGNTRHLMKMMIPLLLAQLFLSN